MLLDHYQAPGSLGGLTIVGQTAYVAAGYLGGVRAFDVSNPRHIRPLGAYLTPGQPKAVAVKGDLVAVADNENGLVMMARRALVGMVGLPLVMR